MVKAGVDVEVLVLAASEADCSRRCLLMLSNDD